MVSQFNKLSIICKIKFCIAHCLTAFPMCQRLPVERIVNNN